MCVFSTPKAPPAVSVPQVDQQPIPSAAAPEESAAPQQSRDQERLRKLRAAAGNDTLVTGGQGLTSPAATGTKQLFGA